MAVQEKLNAKYLRILWGTLNDQTPSYPLSAIRAHWRQARETDLQALAAEITAWQQALWKVVKVGSYIYPLGKGYAESTSRQIANNPSLTDVRTLRLAVRPLAGQSQIVPDLSAQDLTRGCTEFRKCFPLYLSFPQVIPNDEVVSLKMFHREDEPLARLLLDDAEARRLDRLWAEQQLYQPAADCREQLSAVVHRLCNVKTSPRRWLPTLRACGPCSAPAPMRLSKKSGPPCRSSCSPPGLCFPGLPAAAGREGRNGTAPIASKAFAGEARSMTRRFARF